MSTLPAESRMVDFPGAEQNGLFRRELLDTHGTGRNVVQWKRSTGTEIFYVEREGALKQHPRIVRPQAEAWYTKTSAELDEFLEQA